MKDHYYFPKAAVLIDHEADVNVHNYCLNKIHKSVIRIIFSI